MFSLTFILVVIIDGLFILLVLLLFVISNILQSFILLWTNEVAFTY